MKDKFEEFEAETADVKVDIMPAKKAIKIGSLEKIKIKNPGGRSVSPDASKKKFLTSVMKKAGVKELPKIEDIFKGCDGRKMRIKDIAVFLTDNPGEGERQGAILEELAKEMPHRNTINLSTEVSLTQIKTVGISILEAGRLWMPILVSILSDGSKNMECWSGRHRLAFLAIAYGPETEIPVVLTTRTTAEARDSVIYANQSRRVQAMERIEYSVMRVTGGQSMDSVDRDKLYAAMAINKKRVVEFCVKSCVDGCRGMKLEIPINKTRIDRAGTVMATAIEKMMALALEWNKAMDRADVDKQVRDIAAYVNQIYMELQTRKEFDPEQQLSVHALGAIGKLYSKIAFGAVGEEGGAGKKYGAEIADKLIDMGQIGTRRVEEIYNELYAYINRAEKKAKAS